MAEQFYTIPTAIGKAKIANSIALGTKINLTTMKIGDSNGSYYNPNESQTDLVHSVYTCNINSIEVDENNANWINIICAIPSDVGDFYIREAGAFDDTGALIVIGKYPETYKPIATNGSTKEIYIKMTLEVTSTSSIELKIDPTVVLATKKDIDILTNSINSITTQLSDLVYQTAGGTATAITLTMQSLVNGYAKTFIAGASNNGAATTINGKSLYKPNTTIAPNLIAGKAYTVWYNSSKDCFFIKASAEGNTIAAHVLAGDTFSNDSDTGVLGAMPNNGALNSNLNCGGTFKVPAGYTTGGTITANSLASQTQATADQTKILNGYSAWVNGNLVNGNAHKYDYASGTSAPVCINSSTCTYYLNMTGLTSFIPDLVLIQYTTTGGGTCYAMLNNTGIGPQCMWNVYGSTNKSYTVSFLNLDSSYLGFTGADYAHIPIVYHWLTTAQSEGFSISTVNWTAYKFY